jgi:sirohydrochlorin cobaltochelatase
VADSKFLSKAADEREGGLAHANKKALLAISYGSGCGVSEAVVAIEKSLSRACPDCALRRAFISQRTADMYTMKSGLSIDTVAQAMDRLEKEGFCEVTIQPLLIMGGRTLDSATDAIMKYESRFSAVNLGLPLLSSDEDYEKAASTLSESVRPYAEAGTAIVFIGHGTEHEANSGYNRMAEALAKRSACIFVGTIAAEPSMKDVLRQVSQSKASKAALLPMMISAGNHASREIAGDRRDSWKTSFESIGYKVLCIMKGLGEYQGIQELFASHALKAEKLGSGSYKD